MVKHKLLPVDGKVGETETVAQKLSFGQPLALQQHAVQPRQQSTEMQIDPTASREAPRLGPADELVAAGLNVDVDISVEDCGATLVDGLPDQ